MKTNYVQYERSMLNRYVTPVSMDKQFPHVESLYWATLRMRKQLRFRETSVY